MSFLDHHYPHCQLLVRSRTLGLRRNYAWWRQRQRGWWIFTKTTRYPLEDARHQV